MSTPDESKDQPEPSAPVAALEPLAAPAPVLAVPEPHSLLELNAARTRLP